MAGIKQVIQDVLTRLSAIQVRNQDGNLVPIYARVWNNQLETMLDGSNYPFPRPAALVEILTNFTLVGLGVRSADLGIRVHLIHDYYNQDGTMEQDLVIFDLRDMILSPNLGLSQYCPTACGTLNCVGEEQDFNHTNVYHYILNFICNFTDDKGSKYDPTTGFYVYETDPNMELEQQYTINK